MTSLFFWKRKAIGGEPGCWRTFGSGLKRAFIEGALAAIGCDPYFGGLYREYRLRGKGANHANTRVAPRMCQIVWQFPRDKRPYENREYISTMIFPERSGLRGDGHRQTA